VRSGPVLVLPDEIAELLDDASPASDAASDATVAAFLTEHVRSDQPNMLQGLQKALRQRIDAGESRHMATVSALAGRSQLLPHPHDCDRTASIPISFGQRYRLVVDLASTSWCRRRSGCRTSPQRLDSDRGRRCGLHTSPTDSAERILPSFVPRLTPPPVERRGPGRWLAAPSAGDCWAELVVRGKRPVLR
jgi:hypothetical protein